MIDTGYYYSSKEYDKLGLWIGIFEFTKPVPHTLERILGDTYFSVQWSHSNGYSNTFYLDIRNPDFKASITGTLYKESRRVRFSEDDPELIWGHSTSLSFNFPHYVVDDRCDFGLDPLNSSWDEVDSAIMALRLLAS